MKKAFTLQEALITLGIVGVIAAVVLPGVQNIMPDQNKMKYLKAYNTLTKLTSEIISDPEYYHIEYNNTTGNQNCSGGIDCKNYPGDSINNTDYKNNFSNKKSWDEAKDDSAKLKQLKFAMIFADKINASAYGPNEEMNAYYIKTIDGISYEFDNNNIITVDLVPNSDSVISEFNSTKTINEVDNPEQFTFSIDNNGNITPTDELGKAYLKDSVNVHNTKSVRTEIRNKINKNKIKK